MFRSLHCCDFEVNNILLSDEAALCRFLARRFEGDSNRFIMSFDQVIFPNITIFVRGNECVVHYASRDEEPYISTGDRSRNDWVPFKDYMTGGIRAVSDMPGDAIIPWSLGETVRPGVRAQWWALHRSRLGRIVIEGVDGIGELIA